MNEINEIHVIPYVVHPLFQEVTIEDLVRKALTPNIVRRIVPVGLKPLMKPRLPYKKLC